MSRSKIDNTEAKMNKIDILDGFLKKNTIIIDGDINKEIKDYVRRSLAQLYLNKSTTINLLITSNGGSLIHGLEIFDNLNLFPGLIRGVVIGHARSMAAVILQSCDYRTATPNAKLLFHNHLSNVSYDEMFNKTSRIKFFKEMKRDNEKMEDIIIKRSGLSLHSVRELFKKDADLNVDEAIELGLLDHIENEHLF